MDGFLTDKQTEELLVLESRALSRPEGGTVTVTEFAIYWRSLDAILSLTDYTEKEIVRLARINQVELQCDFKAALSSVIGYIHNSIR